MNDPPSVSIKVWGDYACFTRPELKVERLSYPIMTPSAARGVLDAVLYKPQMRWHIRRITALKPWWLPEVMAGSPYDLIGIRRNEIQGKISPRTVNTWIQSPDSFEPYLVDSAGRDGPGGQNRTQRNTLALRDVAYLIHATPILTDKANRNRLRDPDSDEPSGPDTVAKYVAMFQRRVSKGQCFHRPYLGCREFICHFGPEDGTEQPIADWTEDLGMILYDIHFGPDGRNTPGFFHARVANGILHCDTLHSGPSDEAPVDVQGWPTAERGIAS